MARSASLLWPTHHLLQPFRPVAKSRSMGRVINSLAGAHDAAVQMIDTSIVRVHHTPPALLETEANRWVAHEAD